MIVEAITSIVFVLVEFIFNILPDIPAFPDTFMTSLNNVFNTIFNNLDLLGIFVRIDTIKILVPLVIVAINFEHIYHFVIWVVKKIPLSID